MAITAEHYLKRHHKRRRPWRSILLLLLVAALAYTATLTIVRHQNGTTEAGVGKPLNLAAIDQLPDWAREVIHDQGLGADYQFVATIIDLDRDQQLEILLAPAPPRPDLFFADHPLAFIRYQDQQWHYQATPVSCRPVKLGSFTSNGFWDLPCRTSKGRTVLRWSGNAYESTH